MHQTTLIELIRCVALCLMISLGVSGCDSAKDEHPAAQKNGVVEYDVAEKEHTPNTESHEPITLAPKINPSHNPKVIHFTGFGPAAFGQNEEAIRQAWGRPLLASTPAVGATCYYLYQESVTALHYTHQRGIAFMFEDGHFVRYDVNDTSLVAPGNIVIGDDLAKILQAHTQFINVQPHKYIEGAKTVVVTEEALTDTSTSAKLIFELDAQDRVIQWRIGIAPQIYYVEGCS